MINNLASCTVEDQSGGDGRHHLVHAENVERSPDGIVRADVIVHRFGQKQKLVAFEAGNVRHTRF